MNIHLLCLPKHVNNVHHISVIIDFRVDECRDDIFWRGGVCDRVNFSGSCLQITNSSFMVFTPHFPRFDITWFEVSLTGSKCRSVLGRDVFGLI